MKTRKKAKANAKVIAILVVTVLLTVLSLQTIGVATAIISYRNSVIESQRNADKYIQIREEANRVYEGVIQKRAELYNSPCLYVRFLSTTDNSIRIPVAILVMLSPFIFLYSVRWYNMIRRKKARR